MAGASGAAVIRRDGVGGPWWRLGDVLVGACGVAVAAGPDRAVAGWRAPGQILADLVPGGGGRRGVAAEVLLGPACRWLAAAWLQPVVGRSARGTGGTCSGVWLSSAFSGELPSSPTDSGTGATGRGGSMVRCWCAGGLAGGGCGLRVGGRGSPPLHLAAALWRPEFLWPRSGRRGHQPCQGFRFGVESLLLSGRSCRYCVSMVEDGARMLGRRPCWWEPGCLWA